MITCGHRCPKHNSYADPSKENLVSKHQIGAEVDFYVEGMENKPLEVLEHLFTFYKETALYQGKREFDTFHRFKGKGARASTSPWFNKEIFIQLFQPDEERDLDNAHPYPYLSIQVRFDRDTEEQVAYQWKKAHLGYPRG